MYKRLLIIDNDQYILNVLEEALEYEGYDVHIVNDTDDILLLVNTVKPDLLLLDYLLNGINGGELCGSIKRDLKNQHLPVVMMSAYP